MTMFLNTASAFLIIVCGIDFYCWNVSGSRHTNSFHMEIATSGVSYNEYAVFTEGPIVWNGFICQIDKRLLCVAYSFGLWL